MPERERRHGPRMPVQMWVEETSAEGTYFNHSANLSAGGIYLEKTIPHPVGTVVQLQFTLPGDPAPIRVRAKIVAAMTGDDRVGMGLNFVDAAPDVVRRINKYIDDAGGS
ncbi:MAG TPA: PilZ domain-containing protein [Polyangia bacterium]|nr:PilZ domain-containing protein [Polyangia bacterium]